MMRHLSVKLLLAVLFAVTPLVAQDAPPDPRVLLKSARVAQANLDWKFTGHLRVGSGSKKIPFILTVSNGLVKYEFQDTREAIALHLEANGTRLEETRGGKTQRVPLARYGETLRDTSISYEDLAFRFLYWQNARLVGDDKILARDCWVVQVFPPGPGTSQYTSVKVWLSKEDNAVMKMESYGANGRMVRKYTVRSVMKRDDYWFLKQMEIIGPGSKRPTFLELHDLVR